MSSSAPRVPDSKSEARLLEIRREAERKGRMEESGIRPSGAPLPLVGKPLSYYGMPLLKPPAWTWGVPLYFFIGGASGSAAVIGAMADWIAHDRPLARHARFLALGGALLSTGLLITDLGRPKRFLAMLRVFKRQSPMSVGAWVLMGFSSSLGTALFARWVQRKLDWTPLRALASTAEISSVFFGLPFSNYTGVLIGATAIPVWHENVSTLPLHFGMSGLSSGVAALELMGHDHSRGLNLLGMLAAAVETWEGYHIETTTGPAIEPLKHGGSGWLTRTGGVLSGPVPLALRAVSLLSGSRKMRRVAAVCSLTGSLVTRYAWMRAGHASIRDSQVALGTSEG